MRYEITFEGQLMNADGLVAEEIEAFVDSAVGELEVLEAEDIDVSTNLVTGTIRVAVSLEADDLTAAQEAGGGLIRSAIHAAGGGTAGWSVDWLKASTMRDELVNA